MENLNKITSVYQLLDDTDALMEKTPWTRGAVARDSGDNPVAVYSDVASKWSVLGNLTRAANARHASPLVLNAAIRDVGAQARKLGYDWIDDVPTYQEAQRAVFRAMLLRVAVAPKRLGEAA